MTIRRWTITLWMAALLAPLVVLFGGQSAASAADLCLPQPDKTSCIASTMGSRAEPIEGVDVTLTGPGGTEETVTTGADGKWSFAVTETGSYTLTVDPATLPKGQVLQRESATVEIPELGKLLGVNLQVRSEDYDASTSKVEQLIQNGVNGIRLGLLLAMASLGLSLIYGTTGLSNFAHAELVTLGGVLGYGFIGVMDLPILVGGLLVIVVCAGLGFLQDWAIWRPLRKRGLGLTQMMIVTIGMALALQYIFQLQIGAGTAKLTGGVGGRFVWGPVTLTHRSVIAMIIAAICIGLVGFMLLRTRIGRATRAVSDNPALAAASGIDVDSVIRIVWTLSGALAGLSGLLYALVVQGGGVRWDTGMQILLLLFAAVTLGGLGTAFGAFIGSIIIGLVVELAAALGVPGNLKYGVALAILIVLLMFRPQGLLGRAERVG